jgi:hypothetical protein
LRIDDGDEYPLTKRVDQRNCYVVKP